MTEPGTPPVIGIIGGSGVYSLKGLEGAEWREVVSPFGRPSDAFLTGTLDGQPVAFLPRHGRGHRLPPSELNNRANIDGFKRLGCTEIISLSACGSLRKDLPPGTFVVVDQFIDRSFARAKSFFGSGLVAHVTFGHPVCARLNHVVAEAAVAEGIDPVLGGTYLVMEGPQFSTIAESNLYRAWGCDVIGMTNMPEAKLAREAEMCYATLAMVTDFDCWHPDYDHVSIGEIIRVVKDNAERAAALVQRLVPLLKGRSERCPHGCHTALDHAIVTAPFARDPELVARLDAVAGRVLGASSS